MTALLERELRGNGFADAQVAGARITARGIAISEIRLAADDFVLEGVRAKLGVHGLERLAIDRLRVAAEVGPNGRVSLPGARAERGGDSAGIAIGAALDRLPADGVTVDSADIVVATPYGPARVSLAALRLERSDDGARAESRYVLEHAAARIEGAAAADLARDGAARARFDVDGGRIGLAYAVAEGVTGAIVATVPARAAAGPAREAAAVPAEDGAAIEVSLEAAETRLGGSTAGSAGGALGDPGRRPAGTLSLRAAWRGGTAEFLLESRGPLAAEAVIEGRAVLDTGLRSITASGRALLDGDDAQGELTAELRLSRANAADALEGSVAIAARELSLSSLLSGASLDLAADIDVDVADASVRLTSATAWNAALTPAAALLPDSLQALSGTPLTITFAPSTDAPLELRVALDDASARLDASVTARAAEARVRAAGGFTARWADAIALTAEPLRIDAAGMPWNGLALGVDGFAGTAAYEGNEWRIDGTGELRADGTLGGARFDTLTASWSGTIAGSPQALTVTPDTCIEWRFAAAEWGEFRLANAAPPCMAAPDGGALAVYRPSARSLEIAFISEGAPLDTELVHAGEAVAVRGAWPALTLTGTFDAAGAATLDATLEAGALTLPDERVAIEGVQGTVAIDNGSLSAAALTAAAVESLAEPALWVPLALEASARTEDDALELEALLSDDLGSVVLEAAGRAANGTGTAELTLYPVQFVSGATQIEDVSPALAEHVTNASGSVGFGGTIAWSADGLTSAGVLEANDVSATVSGVPIAGVDAAVQLDSLLPPSTPPGQTLRIEALALGVPLTNGVAEYRLDESGRIAVERLAFELAGGRVSTAPFIVDSATPGDIRFVLEAEDVDLSQLLELSRIDGLQGTGALSGRVPVAVSARGVQLDDGVLAAETDGVLRYTPEDLPEFLQGDDVRSRMLREALTNFQYEELSVAIASDVRNTADAGDAAADAARGALPSGEQTVRLSAKGANPDFLDGHPIELNFNFRGPLLGAMRSAAELSGGEAVQQLFEQQDENDSESAR